MRAEWFIQTEKGEEVGVIKMEGNWKDPVFRKNFIEFVHKMDRSVSDTSVETITEKEE